MNTFGSITYEFFNNKKNYHFDLTGAFSILFTKSLSFYAITFRKHTDAHRSRFNLLLLKKKRTQN